MDNILYVDNLCKKYKNFKLNNVSLKLPKGFIMGLIGENGAGKTTLLRMLGGILTPTSGNIKIAGSDYLIDKNIVKKEIGYLSGNTKLYNRISPRELLTIFGNLYEMSKENIEKSIEEISEIMNMGEFIDNRIENLSTGQTQRTSIARCLIHSPQIYIFDEPTSGLDPLMEQVFQEEVEKIKAAGKSILLSSHILSEVERLADKIVIIRQGEIVEAGNLNELRHLTRSTITLVTEGDVAELATVTGVHDLVEKDNQATFSADNEHLNDILLKATQLGVKKFEAVPPTLADLFMRHYES
mgnify:CR=1 FL=1